MNRELFEMALAVREKAYAPYSGCKVGAAVRTTEKIYAGCNIENASYGATICAERVAIGNAVAAESTPRILEIMVVTDEEPAWPPCGICRQVIAEFGPDCTVHWANLVGETQSLNIAQLLPHAFEPGHLKDS